jgi:hypothetical protein
MTHDDEKLIGEVCDRPWMDPSSSEGGRMQAEARVAAALEAGGRLADGMHVPHWWTLASPENHGVDIAAWPDFEDDEED